jgi:hypothetical protein
MRQELEEKLAKDYPQFFCGRDKPLTESLMGFGCEHGDGWYDLLSTLCRFIQEELESSRYVEVLPEYRNKSEAQESCEPYVSPTVEFVQIKEKFGTLRIYYEFLQPQDGRHHLFSQQSIDERYNYLRGRISAFVSYTEYLSGKTCEVCGKPGKTYYGGWISTKCPEHASPEQLASDGEPLP